MKNSFSSSYKTTTELDGSVKITYRASILLSPNLQQLAIVLSLPFALFIILFSMAASHNSTVGNIGLVVIAVLVFRFLFGRNYSVVVKPGQGLVIGKKHLPFSDIDSFGVTTVSSSGRQSGYVYAESRGREISITKFVELATANALSREIKNYAGI